MARGSEANATQLLDGAEEFLASAEDDAQQGRHRVAYECARHAAELAAKALVVIVTGQHPGRDHEPVQALLRADGIPPSVSARELRKLLASRTLGRYQFHRPVRPKQVQQALRIARRVVAEARRRHEAG